MNSNFYCFRSNAKKTFLISVGIFFAALSAQAGEVMERVERTKQIKLGYRVDATPFSYHGEKGQVIGYTIDLCNQIAQNIKEALKIENLEIKYVPIKSSERISSVVSGDIDIECSETINTPERRQKVAFGLTHFYSGVQLLAHKDKDRNNIKRIAVIKDSTAEQVFKLAKSKLPQNSKAIVVNSNDDALKALEGGKVDAILQDDILLAQLIKKSSKPLALLDNPMSIEPLSLMYNKNDKELGDIIQTKMRQIYKSGEMTASYRRWFQNRLPTQNYNLNLQISPLLSDNFRRPSSYVAD